MKELKLMNILGIETSCDETGAAIVKDGKEILSSVVASQADLFAKYGGVIPEIASRKHLELLTPIINQALEEAALEFKDIDAISYTKEPGLMPALLVGISHAKALAMALGIPAIPINHLEAHVYANTFLSDEDKEAGVDDLRYPHVCLLVSGGHTNVLKVTSPSDYEVLGSTRDDAAGEAFDKVARLLDLPYPGGPVIDKLSKEGDEAAIDFPRPMINSDDFDFSFSGLKTAVLYEVKKRPELSQDLADEIKEELNHNWKADIAASFQEAVVDVLVKKTMNAATKIGADTITMGGGVAANSRLREKMIRAGEELGFDVRYPQLKFCLDNAAMIAGLGYWKAKN